MEKRCTDKIEVKARKPKPSKEDSDFRASDEEDSNDSYGSGERERPEKPWKPTRATEIRLLHTIDPRLERNWFTKEQHRKLGKPLKREAAIRHWLRLVLGAVLQGDPAGYTPPVDLKIEIVLLPVVVE